MKLSSFNSELNCLFEKLVDEHGLKFERQETALINSINSAINSTKKPITVIGGHNSISNVKLAKKVSGVNKFGKEPFADIEILTKGKTYLISAKGPTAPSLGGGGMEGLNFTFPELIRNFLSKAEELLVKRGIKANQVEVPNIYGKISDKIQLKLLAGTPELGGPIDYVYIGAMDPNPKLIGNRLELDGQFLTPAEILIHKGDVYLRIRKRRDDQSFEPGRKDKAGLPAIFGQSPSKPGEVNRRLVVTNDVPKNALIINL